MKQFRNKRIYAILLAVLMLLGSVMGVYAEELITGVGDWLVDIGIIEDSIDDYPVEDELVPQAATACITYYRYGESYEPRPEDIEYVEINGQRYVDLDCGVSVNTRNDIQRLINRYGEPRAVTYIPEGLVFNNPSGTGTHYFISPAYHMTEEEYRALCAQIR